MDENKARCHEAAQMLRHRVNQGRYAGMRGPDEGYVIAALLEVCAFDSVIFRRRRGGR